MMPEFENEEEFEKFFSRETEICAKHRNADGMLEFESMQEFYEMLGELMPEHKVVEIDESNFALVPKERR